MARNIEQITQELKLAFLDSQTIREVYALDIAKTYDQQLSKVSIESLLIYIVSVAVWTLEKIVDGFRMETDERLSRQQLLSLKWYWRKALEFQKGDSLVLDEKSYRYGYAVEDDAKRVVRFASVSDIYEGDLSGILVRVANKDKNALLDDELGQFRNYMGLIGAAGTRMEIYSNDATVVFPKMTVYYDPLVLDKTGKRVAGSEYPVDDAVRGYLDNLDYGAMFSAMALVDRLQQTLGVVEVRFEDLLLEDGSAVTTAAAVRVVSPTGAFRFGSSKNITYNV